MKYKTLTYAIAMSVGILTVPLVLADSEKIVNSDNGHSYQRIDVTMNWQQAKEKCESLDGHLATLTSQQEEQFVYKNLIESVNQRVWLGGTDEVTEGTWQWITGETWEYTHWDQDQPDNSGSIGQDYLQFRPWNAWDDLANSISKPIYLVCEWSVLENCQHATYSLKKRTLTVPFVEMPVVDFLTGQPTGEMELWTGNLKQVFGTTNRFRLMNKTVAQIMDGSSSSCPATYAVDTGTLSIPYIDVPTGIAVGNQKIENGVDVFKATMTWEPMGKSFVVQEVEKLSNSSETLQSCADIKTNNASATDGLYEIDPDGTGGNQPFEVYCDMTADDGGWTLIFRHDASDGYFSGIDEAANVNQDNPGLSTKKYSILNQLESFKKNDKFQFRINWPGFTKRNIWTQTSNPTEDVDVAGYQGISVDSTSNFWGGLEFSNGSHGPTNGDSSYLDGSVNQGFWFYAIGSFRQWGATEGCYNALPAADTVTGYHCGVQTVELWVK